MFVCQVLQIRRSSELLGVEVVGPVAGVAFIWSKRRVRERGARVNEAA